MSGSQPEEQVNKTRLLQSAIYGQVVGCRQSGSYPETGLEEITGGRSRRLARSTPAWSPMGDSVVFTSERGGSAALYRIRPDGTGLDRRTDASV
jgi:Tol biopolymer transport system component